MKQYENGDIINCSDYFDYLRLCALYDKGYIIDANIIWDIISNNVIKYIKNYLNKFEKMFQYIQTHNTDIINIPKNYHYENKYNHINNLKKYYRQLIIENDLIDFYNDIKKLLDFNKINTKNNFIDEHIFFSSLYHESHYKNALYGFPAGVQGYAPIKMYHYKYTKISDKNEFYLLYDKIDLIINFLYKHNIIYDETINQYNCKRGTQGIQSIDEEKDLHYKIVDNKFIIFIKNIKNILDDIIFNFDNNDFWKYIYSDNKIEKTNREIKNGWIFKLKYFDDPYFDYVYRIATKYENTQEKHKNLYGLTSCEVTEDFLIPKFDFKITKY